MSSLFFFSSVPNNEDARKEDTRRKSNIRAASLLVSPEGKVTSLLVCTEIHDCGFLKITEDLLFCDCAQCFEHEQKSF